MLLRQDGRAGCNPADERQRQLGHAGQRKRILVVARFIDRSQGIASQTDPARRSTHQLNHTLACQRLQMLLGRIGRLEPQFIGDLGPGRGEARIVDGFADQI